MYSKYDQLEVAVKKNTFTYFLALIMTAYMVTYMPPCELYIVMSLYLVAKSMHTTKYSLQCFSECQNI